MEKQFALAPESFAKSSPYKLPDRVYLRHRCEHNTMSGMADSLDQFLRNSQCEKLCAYVIPVYEIDEKAGFPRNKSEMLQLAKNKMARPFHQRIYKTAQSATNYKRWVNTHNRCFNRPPLLQQNLLFSLLAQPDGTNSYFNDVYAYRIMY